MFVLFSYRTCKVHNIWQVIKTFESENVSYKVFKVLYIQENYLLVSQESISTKW